MRAIPISVLLSFPTPNYENPETHGTSLIVVNAVFAALVVMTVTLRLYTRVFIKRWLGSDDIAMIFAAIFTLAFNACVMLANARFYWDRHIWDVPISEIPNVGKVAMAAKTLFVFASSFTRLSLLCFYYRLTADTGLAKYKWAIHVAMAFNVAIFVTFVPLAVFLCTPVSAYWIFPSSGKCLDEGQVTLAAGVINCFADLLITVLPIPMIMTLKMPLKQRLGVAVLLSLGLVVTIAGIVRTYYIWKALVESYDQTWYAYPLWICAAVEIDLAVLCACAPTLRPLIIRFTKPIISSISTKYGRESRTGRSTLAGDAPSTATNPLTSNADTAAYGEHELEKLDLNVGVHESSRNLPTEPPRRKWSKSWRRGSHEELETVPQSPQSAKLVIMESQSFEVRHEDRPEVAGRPSQDPFTRFDDTAHDLRNQWLGRNRSSADKMFGHKHQISSPRSNIDDTGPKSQSRTSSRLSPVRQHVEGGSSRLASQERAQRKEPESPVENSFYISHGSQDGDDTSSSERSLQWPLQPAPGQAGPLSSDDRHGRDSERNPFRNNSPMDTDGRASRTTTSEASRGHERPRSKTSR